MDVGGHWEETISPTVYFAIAARFVEHVTGYWMAICTPANSEEEFVLTDTGYNVHEGPTVAFEDKDTGECISLGPAFHYFAPIAPRLVILLRSQHLPEPLDDGDPDNKAFRRERRKRFIDSLYGSGTESIMEDLPVHIAFNSKDVFLDLVEWYLTEPCEVGKNLIGENRETKRRYIEQLITFMAAQGREVSTKVISWPTRKDLDIARFRENGISAVRWVQELAKDRGNDPEQAEKEMDQQPVNEADPGTEENSRNESETSREDGEEPERLPDEVTNFDSYLRLQCYLQGDTLVRAIYERVTKRAAPSQSHPNVPRDVSTGELEHSLAMFHIWLISAHLDRHDKLEPDDRLENLLQSFPSQEPKFVFWHFLKRIRHALKKQEQASSVIDGKGLEGPEDAIEDGPIQIPYISNTIMWKVMIKDISKSRKTDRELSLLELTSLIEDDKKPKKPAQSNSTTTMCSGKVSSPTVADCKEDQTKEEKERQRAIEDAIRMMAILALLLVMLVVGAASLVILVAQLMQWLTECLTFEDSYNVKKVLLKA
ncbi:unnamed protein product [Fusarium equiseti]|uniref:Uncharacterized protein n=1 Tax=Fusarium equiseti TaxID=61235 RepID=A0A8J2NGG7_FUSEQ|nr:unnamed protein product [Fusarium equiseti]